VWNFVSFEFSHNIGRTIGKVCKFQTPVF